MGQENKKSTIRVKEALESFDFDLTIVTFDASTRTASDAAKSIGCDLNQIAKSLIFKGKKSELPIMVVASGSNRVDTKKIAKDLGEKLRKADADFVRQHTGYAIGGIPPIGHTKPIKTIIDEDLLKLDVIWAAAGTPNSVFKLTPTTLQEITKGKILDIKQKMD